MRSLGISCSHLREHKWQPRCADSTSSSTVCARSNGGLIFAPKSLFLRDPVKMSRHMSQSGDSSGGIRWAFSFIWSNGHSNLERSEASVDASRRGTSTSAPPPRSGMNSQPRKKSCPLPLPAPSFRTRVATSLSSPPETIKEWPEIRGKCLAVSLPRVELFRRASCPTDGSRQT